MDAKGWIKSKEPRKLLAELKDRGFDRQLRLFACTLARMRWHKMEPAARGLVLAVERYLDGIEGEPKPAGGKPTGDGPGGPEMLALACTLRDAWEAASTALDSIRLKKEQVLPLMRCLFVNPFKAIVFDPPWAFANDSAVLQLARVISQTGDFTQMPILADALQDAGCHDADILDHVRGGARHSRNCWVLERILAMAVPPEQPLRVVWPDPPLGHPDYTLAHKRKAQPCPCCRRGVRMVEVLPPGLTPDEHLFIHCWLCEHIEWITTAGLGDTDAATLKALEIVSGRCPECGQARRAFRAKSGENFGRAFLKCVDRECNSFEWAEIGPGMSKVTTVAWAD